MKCDKFECLYLVSMGHSNYLSNLDVKEGSVFTSVRLQPHDHPDGSDRDSPRCWSHPEVDFGPANAANHYNVSTVINSPWSSNSNSLIEHMYLN